MFRHAWESGIATYIKLLQYQDSNFSLRGEKKKKTTKPRDHERSISFKRLLGTALPSLEGRQVTLPQLTQQHTLPAPATRASPPRFCLRGRISSLRTGRAGAQQQQLAQARPSGSSKLSDAPGRGSSTAAGLQLLPSPPSGRLPPPPPSATAGCGARRQPGPEAASLPPTPINNPARRPAASRHYASPQPPAHRSPRRRGPSPPRQRGGGRPASITCGLFTSARRRYPPLSPPPPLPSLADGAEELRRPRSRLPARPSRDATGCRRPDVQSLPAAPAAGLVSSRLASPPRSPADPARASPGGAGDGRQRRGALTGSSQGLSPALPGASAPAAQRLHLLSGRSSPPLRSGYGALWSARSPGAPARGQPGPSLGG